MSYRRDYRFDEARPRCPECGSIVDPKKAVPLYKLPDPLPEHIASRELLLGIYCNADHAIDAYERGWPSGYLR